eukprot:Skav209152  [mRNA]  locus=scaffold1137:21320:23035:- [translate_table: standard]
MEGSVVKQSKHLREWRRRWCVLTPQYLCSFKNQAVELASLQEFIRLADCSGMNSAETMTGRENSFCPLTELDAIDAWTLARCAALGVQTAGRAFVLIAASATEKERWLSRLGRQLVINASTVYIEDDYE